MDVAIIIILGVLVVSLPLLFLVFPDDDRTDDPVIETPEEAAKSSQLARLVWAAHVAVEEHDEAVLMGSADQVAHSLLNVIYTSNNLENYLRQQKEKSHDTAK